MPGLTHELELRVRYAETDQMGVVYHANYLVWCEIGRTEFIRVAWGPYSEVERAGVALAVVEAELRFHAPARYDDLVRVQTRLTKVKSRTVTFNYSIFNAASGERLATASTTLVAIGTGTNTVTALPDDMRTALEREVG